nr:phage protease [uncultured Albidiferax sp.]
MKRSIIATTARHFLLEEAGAPGVVRCLSQAVTLGDGVTQSWITLTRTGQFWDPRYGDFEITSTMLSQMVGNFDKGVYGQMVQIDVAHKHADGSAAKILKLAVEGPKLRALVEWTPFGIDAVKQRGFIYLSAEFHEQWVDNEHKAAHGCVLLGAGLTIRPVIKGLDPVQLSVDDQAGAVRTFYSRSLLKELTEFSMNKYLKLLSAALVAIGFTDATGKPFADLLTMQLASLGEDDAKCLAAVDALKATAEAAMVQIKAAGGDGKHVTIQLATPTVDVAGAVRLALDARDAATLADRTGMATKLKLLSDTIADGDKTLTPEGVKKFADDYAPMVSSATTDDQVKHLAALAIKQAQSMSAAVKLATLGYNPVNGTVQISVDSSNGIKALQETVDKRLGFAEGKKADRRFDRTGGVLLAQNKDFADKCLAQFDALNGQQLSDEHKALAAGAGSISDVAVPKIAERTVVRESLYNLMSLGLVDVGTIPFSNVLSINYSYRDQTAAVASGLRRYERQAIRNAGVIQTSEETRPIPQKLAMQVSNEMKLLMAAANIDFDPIADNVLNMARIVGEDVELLNLNEIAGSADEWGAYAVSTETLTANVNGTKRIFPLANFPVVKPRAMYDLKGVQQGTTLNPITVTLGGAAKTEYLVPADGSTLAAGQYWVMDYNMGELQFLTETGAAYTPPNTTALTVAYSTTTNVKKFDTDQGAVATDVFYDTLLFAIGGRKSVIEDTRYYNANMILMSGNVNNALSQAKTFGANSARTATGLVADGSVGLVKDMPVFRPRAPGSLFGDTRIVVGQRFNTRFRMAKPWSMTPLEQARNSAGAFIDAMEGFGTQWVGSHTPSQLKGAATSIILYSTNGRIARAV